MSLRDVIRQALADERKLLEDLGFRLYEVAIRRIQWPEQIRAPDTTPVVTDYVITPRPRVKVDPPWSEQEVGTRGPLGSYTDRIFTIDKITPSYTTPEGVVLGFRPSEFELVSENERQEVVIMMKSDDDGVEREYEVVSREFVKLADLVLKVRLRRVNEG